MAEELVKPVTSRDRQTAAFAPTAGDDDDADCRATDDLIGPTGGEHNRPGGNVTGASVHATGLIGKRQEILLEAVPGVRRMAAFANTETNVPRQLHDAQAAARARGSNCGDRVSKPEEIAPPSRREGFERRAIILGFGPDFRHRQVTWRRRDAAAAHHLLAGEFAEAGGLISYGPRLDQLIRDVISRQIIKF